MSDTPIALVTGSGRKRIGNEVALSLAKSGFAVVVHYNRSKEPAEELVEQLKKLGAEATAVQADFSESAEIRNLAEQALGWKGRVDLLVHTASVWRPTELEEVTVEDLEIHLQTNSIAAFLLSKEIGLAMTRNRSGGSIILIGDWAISRPYLGYSAYFLAKGSIPTLTRTFAVELGTRNPKVRVNCIHPGPALLPEDLSDEERKEILDATLTKSEGGAESIAQGVKFFWENQFVTGTCLPLDGGRTVYAPE